ncbi:MAG TPA: serine hydrolase domain-containing protein, partial [Gaiellales bacterium]|nr:serine hydrolase domain-containing protein [Gaiellales bacterium]
VAADAAAPTRTDAEASLQKGADALVATGAPGVGLLSRNGKRTIGVTSGLGEVSTKTAIRAHDRIRVASVAKTYTATVVLQLVGEGKLRLADPVERWLPGLVPHGNKISIRQLLNHTSGLADFEYDPTVLAPYLAGDLSYAWAPRKLVEIAVSHPPLFAPGNDESYSSTNYLLAGLIVEARTGHTLGSELNRRIFRPLHLHATSFPTTARMPNPHAHGYLVIKKPPATDVTGLYPFPWAAGAIISNAADTATFYRALLSGRLLSPRLLHAMQTTHAQKQVDIPGQRYGLGLIRYSTPCGTAWGHNGAYPGYYIYDLTSSDGRRQAVIEVNSDPGSVPKATGLKSIRLLTKAYCTGA